MIPQRIILACGNAAVLDDKNSPIYRCNYCNQIVGSKDEPEACKKKRSEAEPVKPDYWMDIENDKQN